MSDHFTVFSGRGNAPRNNDEITEALRIKSRWACFFQRARVRSGFSTTDLNALLECEPGTYEKWESGLELPSTPTVGRLLLLFDCVTNLEFQLLFNQLQLEARLYHQRRSPRRD